MNKNDLKLRLLAYNSHSLLFYHFALINNALVEVYLVYNIGRIQICYSVTIILSRLFIKFNAQFIKDISLYSKLHIYAMNGERSSTKF